MASETAQLGQIKRGEGFGLWLTKQLTGPIILILIIVHFVVNHLVAEGALLSYNDVLMYYQNWFIPVMEALFLILVVVHSLLGLRSILLDLRPSRSALRIIDVLFVILGATSIVYGLWLIRAIVAAGA